MELHPQEIQHLRAGIHGSNIHIAQKDGYKGLLSLPRTICNRGFILIDPSYEMKQEYEDLPEILAKLQKRWPVAVLCLWYPILPAGLHKSMVEQILALNMPKTFVTETQFIKKTNDTVEKKRGMYGSGLLIANLPYETEENLKALSASLEGSMQ